MRAALAATLVPTYGIYAGYELIENVARPGAEEQIDNEKYEYKDRRWARAGERARADARAVPHPDQRDPPRPPGPAPAAQPAFAAGQYRKMREQG